MRELQRRSGATALIGRGVLSLATAWLLVSQAAAQNFVRPGETVTLPTSITNADDNGDPGGDTISSMKVIVTGDSAFVTNPAESATQSIAPGETKTFTPSFVVGSGPGVVDGQTYTVRLKQVSPDAGIDPDPDDPASFVIVNFPIGPWPFFDGSAVVVVRQNAVRGGLKFEELLRRREVGRLPSKFESFSAGSYGFERFASRRGAFAGCDARKVMRLATWPSLEVAGATLRRARTNLVAFASPSRTQTCRLPVYIECARRIQTWESRWIAAPCAGSSGRWTNAVGECPHHSPPSFRRALEKVPAVGERSLAVRRGFLSGKAGKKGRGVRQTAGKAGNGGIYDA